MFQADPRQRALLDYRPLDALAVLEALGVSAEQRGHIAKRAEALNVGPEAVAIQWRLVEEDAFYATLASLLGLPFIDRPFVIDRIGLSPHAVEAGGAPMRDGPVIIAPQGEALLRFFKKRPADCGLTSPRLLRESLRAGLHYDASLSAAAMLSVVTPDESALRDGHAAGFVMAAWLIMCVALAFAETLYSLIVTLPLFVLFSWTVGQRLLSVIHARRPQQSADRVIILPASLPFYSVLVPLYREEQVLRRLVQALEGLDYPPEKLEVLFLVEEDDDITHKALSAIELPAFMRLVPCPKGAPRTKPRALNVGLHECRGEFVAIYDAEDGPEPDQLLKAVRLFRQVPDDVACLQAELAIENGEVNCLTRGFALEYAALFQFIVPGLCHHGLPVALGGTSNHFRRSVLLSLQGWDAWNVTEDADLGLRLALHGYRVAHLRSRTWEEAPADFQSWRKQRMRWIKGWMQTSLVHLCSWRRMDAPLSLAARVAMLHHLIGTPIAALLTPFFSVALLMDVVTEPPSLIKTIVTMAGLALCVAAIITQALLYGCASPDLSPQARFKALWGMPAYLLLVSASAWLALAELIRAPFHWNKTPHGLAPDGLTPDSVTWPDNPSKGVHRPRFPVARAGGLERGTAFSTRSSPRRADQRAQP